MSTLPTHNPLTRFWLALEHLPGSAAVSPHWRNLIGADYERVSSLLLPDPGRATTFPHPDRHREPYRVVEHGPDDIVGVGEEGEIPIKITRSDLVVYRLDPQRLCLEIARAFDLNPDFHAIEELPGNYLVGLYRPLAGFAFPVYLTIQLEGSEYRAALERLVVRNTGPFLLMAPTPRHHRLASKQLLTSHTAALLALSDTVRLNESGHWERSEVADRLLAEFQSWVLPQPSDSAQVAFFQTPRSARWSDVRIQFRDGHRVSVRVGVATAIFTYTQMGMADGRNAEPTVQWELLRNFAQNRGTLTWKNSAADKKNQKRVELLAHNLRAFFRIEGEPIRYVPDENGWRTVFTIEDD